MKILHIGDIHIGCTLDNQRRNDELKQVFRFLADTVKAEQCEAALLTGDVFDTGNPSTESQNLYYDFLVELQRSGCRQIIVIGGNHDSPRQLEAPAGLLKILEITVVGQADPARIEKEVVILGDSAAPEAVVCAVPYLREADVRSMIPEGEGVDDKTKAASAAVVRHYHQVYEVAGKIRGTGKIPVIGMGHFYAVGSSFASEDEETQEARSVIGTMDALDIRSFPPFDYLALGHIHRPQLVDSKEHIRYAGSLLPMDLRKNNYAPQVLIVDTNDPAHPKGIEIPDRCFHRMTVIEGDLPTLRAHLEELKTKGEPVWVKPVYTGEELLVNWQIDLRLEFRDTCVQLIHPMTHRNNAQPGENGGLTLEEELSLSRMTPEKIFSDILNSDPELTDPAQKAELEELYRKVQNRVCDPSELQENEEKTASGKTMRFKRLWFKNVNSLYDENLIDFEDPAFRSGIFLISGKTGSGKSSILDAVTLALYGETPRSKGTLNQKKDSVMSEGRREVASELVFSIGSDLYTARFSHKRTQRAENPFESTKHTLICNGKGVPGTATQIREEIVRLIGLNMEQFTRCVLLAQGSFDAFMKADAKERSGILGSITGGEIYSRIGKAVNGEYLAVSREYATYQKMLTEGVKLLTDEEIALLNESLTQDMRNAEILHAKIRDLEKILQLFADIRAGEKTLQDAEQQYFTAQKAWAESAEQKTILERAVKALHCSDAFRDREQCGKNVSEAEKELQHLAEQLAESDAGKAKSEKILSDVEKALSNLTEQYKASKSLFQEIRLMDDRIREKNEPIQQTQKDLKSAKQTLKKLQNDFQRMEEQANAFVKESGEAEKYLKEHESDSALSRKAEVWELQRKSVFESEKKLIEEANLLEKLKIAVAEGEKKLAGLRKDETAAEEKLAAQQRALSATEQKRNTLLDGHTEEEITSAKDHALQLQYFYKKSASYAEEREKLKPGEPCPLCGSTAHPLCGEKVSAQQTLYEAETARLKKLLKEIGQCRDILNSGAAETARLTGMRHDLASRCAVAEQELTGKQNLLKERTEQYCEREKKTADEVRILTEDIRTSIGVLWKDHSSLPPELESRMTLFLKCHNTVDRISVEKQRFDAASLVFHANESNLKGKINDAEMRLHQLTEEKDSLLAERNQRFSGNPDSAEQDLVSKMKVASAGKEHAAADVVRFSTERESVLRMQTEKEKRLKDVLTPALEKAQNLFRETLNQNGINSETEYCAMVLPAEKMEKLRAELDTLKGNAERCSTVREERKKNLQERRSALPEGTDEEKLRLETVSVSEEEKNIMVRIQENGAKLKADENERRNRAELREKAERLRKQNDLWEYLNDRLGNADGGRFLHAAQGYTFRELLRRANNNRIPSLKQHFTLIGDKKEPLDLNVIDHLRGDVIRTSRNLSGGECFEVSLALALGLAEMSSVSQNATLGSVFLDEGFGTLDEESLDSALSLLADLRGSGKTVGIISHVAKLKEKIGTQINVTSSDGVGFLSGAGVAGKDAILRSRTADQPEEAVKKIKRTPRKGEKSDPGK